MRMVGTVVVYPEVVAACPCECGVAVLGDVPLAVLEQVADGGDVAVQGVLLGLAGELSSNDDLGVVVVAIGGWAIFGLEEPLELVLLSGFYWCSQELSEVSSGAFVGVADFGFVDREACRADGFGPGKLRQERGEGDGGEEGSAVHSSAAAPMSAEAMARASERLRLVSCPSTAR